MILDKNFEYPGIYGIRNTENGNLYVGSSICMRHRLKNHRSRMENLTHEKDAINQDIKTYGLDAFKFEVIEYFDHWLIPGKSDMEQVEREWMYRVQPYYNSPDIVARSSSAPSYYIWRHFNPRNPWKNRQHPEFVRQYKFFDVRATIVSLFPNGVENQDDKDEVSYDLLRQISRKLQYIPEGTLLYEEGVSLMAAIKTNKVQWWSSAPHHHVIPSYRVEYDFVACDVDMIDRMKFLELDKTRLLESEKLTSPSL